MANFIPPGNGASLGSYFCVNNLRYKINIAVQKTKIKIVLSFLLSNCLQCQVKLDQEHASMYYL